MTILSLTWESPYLERWSLYWDGVLASMDWTKTTARRDENHLSFGIWFILYQTFDGSYLLVMRPLIKKDPFFLEGGAWETLKPWFLTRACWASVVTTRPSGTNWVFIHMCMHSWLCVWMPKCINLTTCHWFFPMCWLWPSDTIWWHTQTWENIARLK